MILLALALLAAPAHLPVTALHAAKHTSAAAHHPPRHAPARSPAQPAKKSPPVRMDEIGITGGTTEYDGMAHTYKIAGNVKVVLREMTVTCNQAIISTSADEEHVDKILFLGDVVATRAHNTFRGDRVTYFIATKRLLAEGDTKTHVLLPRSGAASLQQSLGVQGQPESHQ